MRWLVPVFAILAILVAAAVLVLGRQPSSDGLTGTTWHWTATTTQEDPPPSAVPDPSGYTIEFRPDRTLGVKADCNAVSGTYRRIPPGRTGPLARLTIIPGPSTLVACGPDSLSAVYLENLYRAVSYTIADGRLTIWLSDGGTMTFR